MRRPSPLQFFLIICLLFPWIAVGRVGAQEYNPLVYENLNIEIELDGDGSATFTIHVVLRNDGRVPVVPGYGMIVVGGVAQRRVLGLPLPGSSPQNVSLEILYGKDLTRGTEIEVVPLPGENGSVKVRYSLWQPLRPGQSEEFVFSFTVHNAVATGVLFDEFSLEIGPFSSDVERGSLKIIPPSGTKITYVSPRPSSLSGSVEWQIDGLKSGTPITIQVELSSLPLPTLPARGYMLVWGAAILVLLTLIARRLLMRKEGGGP